MTEKRDLKADLEVVQKAKEFEKITGWGSEEFVRLAPYFRDFHENGIEIAEHAIERAIKAEALVREMLVALEIAYDAMYLDIVNAHDYPNCERKVKKVLAKAKEVLGDE